MQTNNDKIAALRREITAQIVALMKNNELEELELLEEDELDDPTYILFPSDKGNWYESVVRKVVLIGGDIELQCYDEDDNVDAVIGSSELACNVLERLESIRQNVIQTLEITDISAVDPNGLIQLREQTRSTREAIIREMYNCVNATPCAKLYSKTCYRINDEDRDICCIRGFEVDGPVLNAVLEYEESGLTRQISVESLNVEELLAIMLSMLNAGAEQSNNR